MNMLYEGLRENSTIVLAPSTAVDIMQLGGLPGIKAMAKELSKQQADQAPAGTATPVNADNANG